MTYLDAYIIDELNRKQQPSLVPEVLQIELPEPAAPEDATGIPSSAEEEDDYVDFFI